MALFLADGDYSVTFAKPLGTPDRKKPGEFLDKTPATENGLLDATTDKAVIEQMYASVIQRFEAQPNIMIRTGGPHRLLVLDEDKPKPGKILSDRDKAARHKFAEWKKHNVPHWAKVNRAGSGNSGRHTFVRYPEGYVIGNGQHLGSKPINDDYNGSGVDIRAEGGYVIADGSAIIQRDGKNIGLYQFEGVVQPAAELYELSPDAIEKLAKIEPGIVKKRPDGCRCS